MRITDPGIYDIPMAIYRGQPTIDSMSMSASDAICLSESTPAHLRQSWIDEPERDRKSNLGTAIHSLILEPLREKSAIKVIDAKDFRTKAAQEAAAEALANGMMPLLPEMLDNAVRAVDVLRSHPTAAPLFDGGTTERSYFARHKSGVWVKCRPDLVNGAGIMIDVKSCKHAQPEFIRRRIYQGGWYMQSVFHCMVYELVTGYPPADYLWVCVEQEPPHAVAVYRPTRETMVAGDRKNQAAIATFAECVRTGNWPGYPLGVSELGLPDFAHYRLEEEALAEGDE